MVRKRRQRGEDEKRHLGNRTADEILVVQSRRVVKIEQLNDYVAVSGPLSEDPAKINNYAKSSCQTS